MENKREKSSILVQGTILALAGIIVRLISIIYRIPMTNIIGDEGNGYYSSAYQVYSVILLLSSYSLPQAVSKLISQRLAKHQYRNANRIFFSALIFATVSGGLFAALLYFGAGTFADWLKMPLTKMALQVLAPTVFIVSFLGVFRGFFQGFGSMVPTAISQIIEQVVNAAVSIVGVIYFSAAGHRTDLVKQTDGAYAAANGAAGGTLGTLAGAVAGLLCLLILFQWIYPVFRKKMKREPERRVFGYPRIYQMLLATIAPIVLSAVIFNVITVIDNLVLSQALSRREMAESLIASKWGVFSGKYLLLINLPIAFATALASSTIPSIAAANEQRNKGELVHRIDIVTRFTLLLAIPCMIGMAVLANPIIKVLFPRDDSNASEMLMYGAAAIVFFSLATITNSILHGMGKMMVPVKHSLIAFVFHIITLCIMLFAFRLDEYAVVAAYMVFGLVVCILNIYYLNNMIVYFPPFMKTYVLPLVSSAIMGVIVFFAFRLIQTVLWRWVALMIAVLLGMLIYLICIILLKVVDEDDLYELPLGHQLLRLVHKLHLMKE